MKKWIYAGIFSLSAFIAGCKPNPAIPTVSPNIDIAPVTNLYVNPSSGEEPLSVNIKVNGTDTNGNDDIKKYDAYIDIGNDKIIDETISQSVPIDATRTFDKGNVMIYGQCTDSGGLKDKKGLEIIVSEKIPLNPPEAILDINPLSGERLLEVNIKLNGTGKDGKDIKLYQIEIDAKEDGIIDEIISQSVPIDATRTFDKGNVMIYGQCTDSGNLISERANKEVVVSERADLTANITLNFSTDIGYKIGDKLNFSGIVQNNTSNEIIVDNSKKDSLEYKLLKNGVELIHEKMNEDALLKLRPEGTIKVEYNNDLLTFTVTNAKINYKGLEIDTDWLDNEKYQYSSNQSSYKFAESGNYLIETDLKYSVNNNAYSVKFTKDFIVEE
ncbi:Uncharacterised protein [uncultured archaeon]|nr:Uncharacterised protein [uncultured archaeon]